MKKFHLISIKQMRIRNLNKIQYILAYVVTMIIGIVILSQPSTFVTVPQFNLIFSILNGLNLTVFGFGFTVFAFTINHMKSSTSADIIKREIDLKKILSIFFLILLSQYIVFIIINLEIVSLTIISFIFISCVSLAISLTIILKNIILSLISVIYMNGETKYIERLAKKLKEKYYEDTKKEIATGLKQKTEHQIYQNIPKTYKQKLKTGISVSNVFKKYRKDFTDLIEIGFAVAMELRSKIYPINMKLYQEIGHSIAPPYTDEEFHRDVIIYRIKEARDRHPDHEDAIVHLIKGIFDGLLESEYLDSSVLSGIEWILPYFYERAHKSLDSTINTATFDKTNTFLIDVVRKINDRLYRNTTDSLDITIIERIFDRICRSFMEISIGSSLTLRGVILFQLKEMVLNVDYPEKIQMTERFIENLDDLARTNGFSLMDSPYFFSLFQEIWYSLIQNPIKLERGENHIKMMEARGIDVENIDNAKELVKILTRVLSNLNDQIITNLKTIKKHDSSQFLKQANRVYIDLYTISQNLLKGVDKEKIILECFKVQIKLCHEILEKFTDFNPLNYVISPLISILTVNGEIGTKMMEILVGENEIGASILFGLYCVHRTEKSHFDSKYLQVMKKHADFIKKQLPRQNSFGMIDRHIDPIEAREGHLKITVGYLILGITNDFLSNSLQCYESLIKEDFIKS